MILIDSHCHLNYPGLIEQQAAVLLRAREVGVALMVAIATKRAEWPEIIGLAEREHDVMATVGIHPHEAEMHAQVETAELVAAASHARVVGIGETGLDYHYDKSPREHQRHVFRAHIHAAQATGLPLIVHTRAAEEDTLALLAEEMRQQPFTGVIHCFTASEAFAQAALELGLYISFSGILTFKNAVDLQAIAAALPRDRLLVETDSPYLAPVPLRGKACEPGFVVHTNAKLAALHGMAAEDMAAQTTRNFFNLFRKVPTFT